MKQQKFPNIFLFFLIGICLYSCIPGQDSQSVKHEYLTGNNGKQYQLISWSDMEAELTISRPDRNDPLNAICIPITPPDSTGKPFRHYHCVNGESVDPSRFNPELDGAVTTSGGDLELVFANSLASSDYQDRCSEGATLVQSRGIISDGKIVIEASRKKFQCRALVEFEDGRMGMIETLKHHTIKPFAEDLISFGVKNAVMTVTGTFDEGWYYYGGVPVAFGRLRSYTSLQTNWLVLREGS